MNENIKKDIEIIYKKFGKRYKIKECSIEALKSNDKLWNGIIYYNLNLSEETLIEFSDKFKNNIIWGWIAREQILSEDFIRRFKDQIDWYSVSRYQKISEDFMREFRHRLYWDEISNKTLSEDFIWEFRTKLIWSSISRYQKLSEKFIKRARCWVDWSWICEFQVLSEKFIREHRDRLYWHSISQYQKLSEDFIEEFRLSLDWYSICAYQDLSKKFIKQNFNLISWSSLSRRKNLSEDIIEEFSKELNWGTISTCQTLSEDFIRKFKDKVLWSEISKYQNLSKKFIYEFFDKIDLDSLFKNSNKYLKKHKKEIESLIVEKDLGDNIHVSENIKEQNPRFKVRKEDDKNCLLIGFENEMSYIDNFYGYIALNNLFKNTDKFYYSKFDSSCCIKNRIGIEVNSHPFSYNWLKKNETVIDSLVELDTVRRKRKKIFEVNRCCGFHIHLSRSFFSKEDIWNLSHLIFDNPELIKFVSLRGETNAFKDNASLDKDSNFPRYRALNLCNHNTIELRFFQGTLKKKTILSYIEFAVAASLFIKNKVFEDINTKNFVEFINNSEYNNLKLLINGKLRWK